jgi:hydroxymethylglutaryl-CoA lyase
MSSVQEDLLYTSTLPPAVQIVEVGPRDGLQNESVAVPTPAKVEMVRRAVAAGIQRVEVTSFVNPRRVPQMADADEVCAQLSGLDGLRSIGLVLNERGLDRAVAAGVDEVNAVVVATDTFGQANQGQTTAEGVDVWRRIAERARAHGLRASVTVAAAVGCPFEGEVSIDRLRTVVDGVAAAAAPDELALADTIGVAVPADVHQRVEAVRDLVPGTPLRCHFHNTRNTGLANAMAAVQSGVTTLDASTGGIGGCPFAPAATGNIPTEDLLYLLHRSGVSTGIDVQQVMESARWTGDLLGAKVPGLLSRAGLFPQVAR